MGKTSAEIMRRFFVFFLLPASLLLPSISAAAAQPYDEEEKVRLIPLPELSEPGVPLTAFNVAPNGDNGAPADQRMPTIAKSLKELKQSVARRGAGKTAVSRVAAATKPAQGGLKIGAGNRARVRKKSPPAEQLKPAPTGLPRPLGEPAAVQDEEDLKVRMRPIGTPRQIKVEGKVKAQSKVLRTDRPLSENEAAELKVRQFLAKYRGHLRLDDPDSELRLSRSETDSLNWRHFRFQQYHRGLPVWPAEVLVHVDPEGGVDLVEGAFIPTPRNVGVVPQLTEEEAVAAARAHMAVGVEVEATRPELIIYGAIDRPARLAWKLEMNISLAAQYVVVVDALNGEVLTAVNTVAAANVSGAGLDLLGVARPLNVWSENGTFTLIDASKPMFQASTPPKGMIVVGDAQNRPPTNNPYVVQAPPLPTPVYILSMSSSSGWPPAGVSASYNLSKVYDYYYSRHGRNSIDGAGGSINAVVRLGLGYQNAFWAPWANALYFGDGEPYAGALDVVAHEMTHGITSNTAKLVYMNQSGALNEAFSDILAESVENFVTGKPDWLHGRDLGTPSRSLRDPHEVAPGYPARMSEYMNLPPTAEGDNGGVHINSSIINHAYYLLAAGMTGAIGINDAERIFYRALTAHLSMQSNFLDARLACIQSAREIFGSNSVQAARTAAAFDAVEILDAAPPPEQPPGPTAGGSDAVLFLSVDPETMQYRLSRREWSLNDPSHGSWVSNAALAPTRPSVTLDGSTAAVVTAGNDLCLFATDLSVAEECLGMPGVFYSAAMSPDGDSFGFVLLGENGEPDNQIRVVKLSTDTSVTYTLMAPASNGLDIASVRSADAMVFSNNGRFLLYDAMNELRLTGGETVISWSIYALDMVTGQTLTLVPPNQNVDFAYPSIGHTSNDLLTFEGMNKATGESVIFAASLRTGKTVSVASVYDFGVPTFSGDDAALIFSAPDDARATERSLYRIPLAGDHITPAGAAAVWLTDGDFPDVYRRWRYQKLSVNNSDTTSGQILSDVGGISCGESCSFNYPAGTRVTLTARPSQAATFTGWSGACSGTQSCTVTLDQDRIVAATFRGSYSLAGVVRSGSAGGPAVAGATVTLAGKSATTGSNGAFTISGLAAGTYTLTISAPGFTTYTNSSYRVSATQSGINFTLTPTASYLRIEGSGAQYSRLQAAYDAAPSGAVILARSMTFAENPLCAAAKVVTLKGGYDQSFTARSGFTTIDGVMRVRYGSITVDRINIR
jgi:bacillolysin